ncbi:MAG TPA: 3' terminal RNA ribose 2'-O-methyltransferase Hen1 [Gemmatimonadaceae bacterium]|nr:3' terminal RNA ribose 2'-O-methyltransferase Hen1 [Gemmatimonadaceae bacterium]
MLLTITTTHSPATDLGYLLAKHPDRVQTFEQSFGQAHVFYPEASAERTTVALLLDVDPVALVRTRRGPGGEGGALDQYVNDRPYVGSSFLSVALADVFRSALQGKSRERSELVDTPIPLAAHLPVLPCRGGEVFLRSLFTPLGYEIEAVPIPAAMPHADAAAEPNVADEGRTPYFDVTLRATSTLQSLLSHLYVLVPVLDDQKHYWVSDDEVDKLLRAGEGWLPGHPERDAIARRYLRRRPNLVRDAIARLTAEDDPAVDERVPGADAEEATVERAISLNEQRLASVFAVLRGSGARRVVDLGCGEGRLLRLLIDDRQFEEIVGMDVSYRALEIASNRLRLDRMPERQRERVRLLHGSLMYRDSRLTGYDAASVVEVIEHLDPPRLAAFERVLFEFARPATIVVTTPNAEYNVRWATLPAGRFRHRDHRFEWTRAEFSAWAAAVADRFAYDLRFVPVGPVDAEVGAPTQLAIFTRRGAEVA